MTAGRGRSFGSVLALVAVAACGGGTTTVSTSDTTGGEAPPPPMPVLVPQVVHDDASLAISPDGRLLAAQSRYALSITDLGIGLTREVRPDDLGASGSLWSIVFLAPDVVATCVGDEYEPTCRWSAWDVTAGLDAAIGGDVPDLGLALLERPRRIAAFEYVSAEPPAPGGLRLRIVPFGGGEPLDADRVEDAENLPYQLWTSPDGRFVAYALGSEELIVVDAATGAARQVVGHTPPVSQDGAEPDPRRALWMMLGFTLEGALALMGDGSLVVATPAGERVLALCEQASLPFPDRAALDCGEPARPVWVDLATGALRPRDPAEPTEPPPPDGPPDAMSDPRVAELYDRLVAGREQSTWSVSVQDGEIRVQHRYFADLLTADGWTRVPEPAPDAYGSSYGGDYGSTGSDYSTSYEDTSSYEDTAAGDDSEDQAAYERAVWEEEHPGEPYPEDVEDEVAFEDAGPPDPDADFDDSPEAHLGESCWIGRGGDGGLVVLRSSADGMVDSESALPETLGAVGVEASIAPGCQMASAVVNGQTRLFADRDGAFEPVGATPGRGRIVWADRDAALVAGEGAPSHHLFDAVRGVAIPVEPPSGTCFFVARSGDLLVWRTTAGVSALDLRTRSTTVLSVADPGACGLAVDASTLVVRTGPELTTATAHELPSLAPLGTYAVRPDARVGGGLFVSCSEAGLEVRALRDGALVRSAPTCAATLSPDARYLIVRNSSWRGRATLERVADGATIDIIGVSGTIDSIAVMASNGALWVPDPSHLPNFALRGPGPVLSAPMIAGAALEAAHYRPTLLTDFLEGRPLPTPGAPTAVTPAR